MILKNLSSIDIPSKSNNFAIFTGLFNHVFCLSGPGKGQRCTLLNSFNFKLEFPILNGLDYSSHVRITIKSGFCNTFQMQGENMGSLFKVK